MNNGFDMAAMERAFMFGATGNLVPITADALRRAVASAGVQQQAAEYMSLVNKQQQECMIELQRGFQAPVTRGSHPEYGPFRPQQRLTPFCSGLDVRDGRDLWPNAGGEPIERFEEATHDFAVVAWIGAGVAILPVLWWFVRGWLWGFM